MKEGVGPREGKPAMGGEKVLVLWGKPAGVGEKVREKEEWRPAGVGPREGGRLAGVGPREGAGEGATESGNSVSAPDQRKPSKRPEMRISHSELLMRDSVTRRW